MTAVAKFRDPSVRVERLLASLEGKIERQFMIAVAFSRDSIKIRALERLLAAGQVDQAVDLVAQLWESLSREWISGFVGSASATADVVGVFLGRVVAFDQTNFRAVEAMRGNRLRLIRGIQETTRDSIREVLRVGIENGANPRASAKLFRESIGLTPKQVRAVENYRRLLENGSSEALDRKLRDRRFDSRVRRAVGGGDPLSSQDVERMVSRYRTRFVNHRAVTIARTEALRSVHQGSEAMFEQAFSDGSLRSDQLVRTWNTAADERVRSSHQSMHNASASFGEFFTTGDGNLLRFPGDPNAPASETIQCRCVLSTVLTQ